MTSTRGSICALVLTLAACAAPVPSAPPAPRPEVDTTAIAIPRARLASDGGENPRHDYDPVDQPLAFTPDGTLIVSHQEQYSSGDLVEEVCTGSGFYRLPAGGGPAEPLRTGAPACQGMRESAAAPDGTWAVYSVRTEPNNSVLVRVGFSAGRVDTLRTTCAVYQQNPSISPDGRRIAFVGLCRGRDQESFGLYTVHADGSELRGIVPGNVERSPAAWSPDGQRLVYVSRGGWLTVTGADGSGARTLTPGYAAAWSPDGQWIALVHDSRRRGERSVFLIRPDGTGLRAIFVNRATGTYFRGEGNIPEGLPRGPLAWSPDSRWLAFSRAFGGGTSIWRVDIQTGIVQQVTRPDR